MHEPHPQHPDLPSKVDKSKILAFLEDIGIEWKGTHLVSVELGVFDVTVKRLPHRADGGLVSAEATPDTVHIGIVGDAS